LFRAFKTRVFQKNEVVYSQKKPFCGLLAFGVEHQAFSFSKYQPLLLRLWFQEKKGFFASSTKLSPSFLLFSFVFFSFLWNYTFSFLFFSFVFFCFLLFSLEENTTFSFLWKKTPPFLYGTGPASNSKKRKGLWCCSKKSSTFGISRRTREAGSCLNTRSVQNKSV
jgi:hypothetical protein